MPAFGILLLEVGSKPPSMSEREATTQKKADRREGRAESDREVHKGLGWRRLGDRVYKSCHKITKETAPLFLKRVKIACPVGLERRARVVLKCRVESEKPGRSFTENRTVKSRFQGVTEVTAVSVLAPEGRGGGTVVGRLCR